LSIERRGFLGQITVAGLVAGTSTLPAMAQEMSGQGSATVGSDQLSVGETLARYATGLRYEDLPEDVIRIAKRAILDTFGCAFGGFTAGPSKIAIKLASDVSARQGATVLFSGIRTSPDLAIFANGVMIRYLDFNDAFVSLTHGAGHPSDTIAALLTAAEVTGGSGRDLITAAALAYEVFCKVADTFDYLGSGVDHSTITGFAAVVGAWHSQRNGVRRRRACARP
jgi:2-methylcitrate dehydratase